MIAIIIFLPLLRNRFFIEFLEQKTNYKDEDCTKIHEAIKELSPVGRKNKDKIIKELLSKTELSKEEANEIYNIYAEWKISHLLKP